MKKDVVDYCNETLAVRKHIMSHKRMVPAVDEGLVKTKVKVVVPGELTQKKAPKLLRRFRRKEDKTCGGL